MQIASESNETKLHYYQFETTKTTKIIIETTTKRHSCAHRLKFLRNFVISSSRESNSALNRKKKQICKCFLSV